MTRDAKGPHDRAEKDRRSCRKELLEAALQGEIAMGQPLERVLDRLERNE